MASPPALILLVATATLSVLVVEVSSDRILLLMPLATKSETHLLNPIAKGLLDRGHTVTLVTPTSSSIRHNNFTEVIPVQPLDMTDFEPGEGNVLDMRKEKDDILKWFTVDFSYLYDRCHETYKHKDFAPVLRSEYDLVLTSAFFSECFLGFIHKLQAPYIQLSSMPLFQDVFETTGLRLPLSFVPSPLLEFSDKMTFSQRIINTLTTWSFTLSNRHHYYKIGEKIYKQYFGNDLPGVEELRKNVSMLFSNTHFTLTYPRPLMPDIVEIGGIHCRPAKRVEKDLDEFLSGGKKGFIFFSLGTVFREEIMPPELLQAFLNVFSRLEYRVLFKWKNEIKGLPENIKVSKWLSQQDILGHPRIKLFVSHGGLLSTQEAAYHGVPILGIPIFADQDVNMMAAEASGRGMKLELLTLTEEILENAINRMVNDSSFAANARAASVMFRDQLETPLERAIYWMEYLIRHKGAPQLRSHARNLSYWEYHMYDVQLTLLAIIGVVLFLAWITISFCLSLVEAKGHRPKSISSKKNK